MKKKKYKPSPDHPWSVRTRGTVVLQQKKKKRNGNREAHLLEQMADHESLDHEEEVDHQLREFFL